MEFHGKNYDFDILDADDAERYEAALKKVKEESHTVAGEGMADSIRRECAVARSFFDACLGDGVSQEIFGDKMNLMEHIEVFQEFIKEANAKRSAVTELIRKYATNRAARRANK